MLFCFKMFKLRYKLHERAEGFLFNLRVYIALFLCYFELLIDKGSWSSFRLDLVKSCILG